MIKVLVTLTLGLFMITASTAQVHRHELYDADCCQLSECRPVTCQELKPQSDGTIQFNNMKAQKIKPSKDKDCHVCANSSNVYCVYIGAPQGSLPLGKHASRSEAR